MQKLNNKELVNINGGHNGEDYNLGVSAGRFVTKVGIVYALVATRGRIKL